MQWSSNRSNAARTICWILALGSLILSSGAPAGAATLTVDTEADEFDLIANETCSLREAVESANRDADFGGCTGNGGYGDDSISLPAGTYGLTRVPEEAFLDLDNSVGDLDVKVGGSPLRATLERLQSLAPPGVLPTGSLEILGQGSETTIVERSVPETFGIFQSDFGVSLRIADLTIRGGEEVAGAGIFADSDLRLDRVVVRDNVARAVDAGGGGIVAFETLTLTDTLVADNTVDLQDPCDVGPPTTGGGILAFNFGPLTVERSTVSGNMVTGPSGCEGYGGGLGLLFGFAPVRIVNSTVSGNSAPAVGGVDILLESEIFVAEGALSSGDVPRRGRHRATASWTEHRSVSGLDRPLAPPPLAPLSLEHATIAENSADEIGGLSLLAFSGTPNALIENSLIGDNRAGDAPDCTRSGFTVTSGGTNLLAIDDPLDGEPECLEDPPNLVGTRTDPVDPSLAPLRDNGGQTPTHALLPGSPALDATGDQGEIEDQRGVSRPVGTGFDIGAFEGVALVPLLSATKVVQSHHPGADTVIYRIQITNGGTGPQPDAPSSDELEDVLPPELELLSATSMSPGFTVVADLPSNTVRGNGPIGAGETVAVEILASVIAPPDTAVSNQALVRYDADIDGTNESTAQSDDPATPEPLDPTVFVVGANVLEIPTLDTLGLLLLATTLLLITGLELRRRGAGPVPPRE